MECLKKSYEFHDYFLLNFQKNQLHIWNMNAIYSFSKIWQYHTDTWLASQEDTFVL